ncbi:MAG: lysophospholipid acyltransferase family protein [Fibromonadales bacterium]|nr:lysophospholipid acyltransferase family protein [Fibromonadales bacterium]
MRLTKPFFEKASVKQPKYSDVLKNMFSDAFDFIFRHPPNAGLKIDSHNILEEMRSGGIFLTAHYGNHELLGYRLAELGLPLNAAAQRQKPDFFDRWLQRKRTYKGKCFAERIAVERLIEFIDNGGLFAMLADQDFRKSAKEKCESEFLGVAVRCNPLPAFILKHRPNTPVFCGHLRKNVLFLKKIPTENFYAHYHLWLENLILENPAKWYGWFHGRFSYALSSMRALS